MTGSYFEQVDQGAAGSEAWLVEANNRKDIFGHNISVQPYNQVEMRLDAADWADFVDIAVASGGTVTQSGGVVTLSTSAAATGSAVMSGKDVLEYRPGVGVAGGGTAVFSAGAVGSELWVGLIDEALLLDNCVVIGKRDGVTGILYRKGGADVDFYPVASWNVEGWESRFTIDGAPKSLDVEQYGGPYWVECGLFGFAGWVFYIWSPDNGFIPVHQFKNNGNEPVFTSNSFKVAYWAKKTSGAVDHTIYGQCAVGTSYSPLERLAAQITDRKLAQTVRNVPWGKTPSGSYVPQVFNNNGRALISDDTVGAIGDPIPSDASLQGVEDDLGNMAALRQPLTDAELRAEAVVNSDSGERVYIPATGDILTATTSVIITPSPGMALRIVKIYALNDPLSVVPAKIQFTLGATVISNTYGVQTRQRFEGAVGDTLSITTSRAGPVAYTIYYEEF